MLGRPNNFNTLYISNNLKFNTMDNQQETKIIHCFVRVGSSETTREIV
jgi:hypothetical protein